MLYSRWQPDRGGYLVFEAPDERLGLGDDVPVPSLPEATQFGVPSVEAGRPVPRDAELVGEGDKPVGMLAPATQDFKPSLSGTSGGSGIPFGSLAMIGVGVGIGWLIWKRKRR